MGKKNNKRSSNILDMALQSAGIPSKKKPRHSVSEKSLRARPSKSLKSLHQPATDSSHNQDNPDFKTGCTIFGNSSCGTTSATATVGQNQDLATDPDFTQAPNIAPATEYELNTFVDFSAKCISQNTALATVPELNTNGEFLAKCNALNTGGTTDPVFNTSVEFSAEFNAPHTGKNTDTDLNTSTEISVKCNAPNTGSTTNPDFNTSAEFLVECNAPNTELTTDPDFNTNAEFSAEFNAPNTVKNTDTDLNMCTEFSVKCNAPNTGSTTDPDFNTSAEFSAECNAPNDGLITDPDFNTNAEFSAQCNALNIGSTTDPDITTSAEFSPECNAPNTGLTTNPDFNTSAEFSAECNAPNDGLITDPDFNTNAEFSAQCNALNIGSTTDPDITTSAEFSPECNAPNDGLITDPDFNTDAEFSAQCNALNIGSTTDPDITTGAEFSAECNTPNTGLTTNPDFSTNAEFSVECNASNTGQTTDPNFNTGAEFLAQSNVSNTGQTTHSIDDIVEEWLSDIETENTAVEVEVHTVPAQIMTYPGDSTQNQDLTHDLTRSNVPLTSQKTSTRTEKPTKTKKNKHATNKNKRLRAPKTSITYMDYMSEDELILQNAFGELENSDDWTDGSEDLSSSSESNKKNKKRSKKRKSRANKNNDSTTQENESVDQDCIVAEKANKKKIKNARKENRNAKQTGQEYINYKDKIVPAKVLHPNPCKDKKCGNGCSEICEERRKSLFDHFWGLTPQRRKDWLFSLTKVENVKRKRNTQSHKRQVTYKYHITDGEGHRAVCLQFLTQTLDITAKFVNYTLENSNSFGSTKVDMRGKHVPPNKTLDIHLQKVEEFIKKLPAVPSHYCRRDSSRVYLPSEYKNISYLYSKYLEISKENKTEFVSERIFRKIFNDKFNISFHVPKKDKCAKCVRFESMKENALLTPEVIQAHEEHLREKEDSNNRYKAHKNVNQTDKTALCASFDLQKVLNTPYGDSMLLFYTRKLGMYNFVVHENGTRDGYCFYWDESQGKRGANEIATILNTYINMVDQRGTIKKLLLYCDCCPGQNRNKIILAMIHETLQKCQTLEIIQVNYLLTGHSYMSADGVHANIENSISSIVWAPSAWHTVFENARKNPRPLKVYPMMHDDFRKWSLMADKYFVGNLTGKISKLRIVTFKRNRSKITVKNSMSVSASEYHITVQVKSKPIELPKCYKTRLPIPKKKYDDLQKLCADKIIPSVFHSEYKTLTSSNDAIVDKLLESDIEDEDDE